MQFFGLRFLIHEENWKNTFLVLALKKRESRKRNFQNKEEKMARRRKLNKLVYL